MKNQEGKYLYIFLIELNSILRHVFPNPIVRLYLGLDKNIIPRWLKLILILSKSWLHFIDLIWFDNTNNIKRTNILFSILFFQKWKKSVLLLLLFVIISIAFYSMNQQTRIFFSNNSTLFSSQLPLLVSMRDFRMHFCLLALSRAVCLWSHEFVVEHEFVLHSVVCDADRFNNNIHDSSTECTLFSWTFISKIVERGSEIQRNSSSNNGGLYFYICLSAILEIYSCRDYFDVSFEWKISYNLYSISFENFLTLMKRNFLNFKNSLSLF